MVPHYLYHTLALHCFEGNKIALIVSSQQSLHKGSMYAHLPSLPAAVVTATYHHLTCHSAYRPGQPADWHVAAAEGW